ncbi:hypothetical protein RIVM261_001690 [Rivularia sp. IAM M-261]|nr:hypothetical protein RIVM261_001690 [Rivularia sp. IAM M-261]
MTVTLTLEEHDDLFQSEQNSSCNRVLELFEDFYQMSKQLGTGCQLNIEVYPEFWLCIYDRKYDHDMSIKVPACHHPLQFGALATGIVTDNYGQVGGGHTLISGSGVPNNLIFRTFPCSPAPLPPIDIMVK